MAFELSPPFTPPAHTDTQLSERGFAVLSPDGIGQLSAHGEHGPPLAGLEHHWDDLPLDAHLKDVGQYRRRRHASFLVGPDGIQRVPHRAHWQPLDYNALHGGIERWFEPLDDELVADPRWTALLETLTERAARLHDRPGPWHVEAHAFRIDTSAGIGRPTPEGAHRDGVDLVAVHLVRAAGIKGGETRVFDAAGPAGQRFTMTAPGTTLLLDDARTIHETTPIQSAVPGVLGYRDTLVLTWRLDGFQEPARG